MNRPINLLLNLLSNLSKILLLSLASNMAKILLLNMASLLLTHVTLNMPLRSTHKMLMNLVFNLLSNLLINLLVNHLTNLLHPVEEPDGVPPEGEKIYDGTQEPVSHPAEKPDAQADKEEEDSTRAPMSINLSKKVRRSGRPKIPPAQKPKTRSAARKKSQSQDKKLEEVADLLEVFPVQYQEAARKHPKVGSDGKSILSASVPFLLPAALVQRSLDALCKTDPMALPNQSD
ncbi:hypothetical protein PI124_g4029 [Phytophthora idaei]|nr:hypothetical protein PI124_g4029 [Phytophthora idaei]